MSRQADESRARPDGARSNKKAQKKAGAGIQTLIPTEDQKETLRSGEPTSSAAISYIQEVCERGCNVSLGIGDRDLNAYVILRQRTEDWTDAWCVSMWHSDLETAIRALALCVQSTYPEFPENRPIRAGSTIDW